MKPLICSSAKKKSWTSYVEGLVRPPEWDSSHWTRPRILITDPLGTQLRPHRPRHERVAADLMLT